MIREWILQNKSGLHARPASLFSQEAKKYQCEVEIETDGKSANAKSILSILALGIAKGSRISVKTSGVDEREAMEALALLVENKFDEE